MHAGLPPTPIANPGAAVAASGLASVRRRRISTTCIAVTASTLLPGRFRSTKPTWRAACNKKEVRIGHADRSNGERCHVLSEPLELSEVLHIETKTARTLRSTVVGILEDPRDENFLRGADASDGEATPTKTAHFIVTDLARQYDRGRRGCPRNPRRLSRDAATTKTSSRRKPANSRSVSVGQRRRRASFGGRRRCVTLCARSIRQCTRRSSIRTNMRRSSFRAWCPTAICRWSRRFRRCIATFTIAPNARPKSDRFARGRISSPRKTCVRCMQRERPDVVVCTHAFPCGAMAEYKRRYRDAPPVVGDRHRFRRARFWMHATSTRYVGRDATTLRRSLLARGFARGRVAASGIPVRAEFVPASRNRKRRCANA